ncbi:vitamin K epoxide reductase family protein [Sanguibacter suaedae]|uniref:Vitamin K epoxide reductase family protein n=1 Tax=Sanguibacter suaedae TaxID=2795737 RepID=A0A934M986_9MICO|nr:vitamin K epoxide reductase family protein [Sanguibacter suaedae]MBI9114388.1 vitamin K epoxide reductase family protein [Sanguibacter suaedae]
MNAPHPDAPATDQDAHDGLATVPAASPQRIGWVLVVLGAVGFAASLALAIEKVLKLADPDHVASCSINIFLDCSVAMGSWQGALLGFPNPFIGVAAFPVVVTTGVVVLAGARLPRWYWWSLFVGTILALGLVVFLVHTSVAVLGKLCPYCMVVWAAVVPLTWYTFVHLVEERMIRVPEGVRSVVTKNRLLLALALVLVVVAWVLIGMAPEIAAHLQQA